MCTGCHPEGDKAAGRALAIVLGVEALRHLLNRPGIGTRIVAAVMTVVGLVPLLAKLPKVAVLACFDPGHPLYLWVPEATFTGTAHCVTAPAPAVGWTLMVAATLVMQFLALPLMVAGWAILLRGGRRLVHAAGKALTRVLCGLTELAVGVPRPVPVYVRVRADQAGSSRANPRRGPPNCL